MALRKIYSCLWLIPVFAVLLLWGCGEDPFLVDDAPHARAVSTSLNSPSVVLTAEADAEAFGGYSYSFSGDEIKLTIKNTPRLGDEGAELDLKVEWVTMEVFDNTGF